MLKRVTVYGFAGGGATAPQQHQGLDDVAEYLAGDSAAAAGAAAGAGAQGAGVFRPGWEDIFRMNQTQLEVCWLQLAVQTDISFLHAACVQICRCLVHRSAA